MWGGSDADTIDFGDPSGLDLVQTSGASGHNSWGDPPGYIFLGSKTTVHGNATSASNTADGEDRMTVWYLQSMNVLTSPAGLTAPTGYASAPATC